VSFAYGVFLASGVTLAPFRCSYYQCTKCFDFPRFLNPDGFGPCSQTGSWSYLPLVHWEGVPVGVPHLQSENTIVHASIIRNEKNSCTTIRKYCTVIRIFQEWCCFFLMTVLSTPFYHFLFKKKAFPLFLNLTRQCGMLSARRSTTRAWGCMKHDCLCSRVGLQSVPTHTYVKSWPSCLLQCRTYPGSHESAVHAVMGRGQQSAFVGPFSWLSCARTQVHIFSCLFVGICLHATCSKKIMGIEGITK